VKVKERELALALMRVAELTRQLEQLRQGQLDGILVDSTSTHAKLLDRNPEVCIYSIHLYYSLSFILSLFLIQLLAATSNKDFLCLCYVYV